MARTAATRPSATVERPKTWPAPESGPVVLEADEPEEEPVEAPEVLAAPEEEPEAVAVVEEPLVLVAAAEPEVVVAETEPPVSQAGVEVQERSRSLVTLWLARHSETKEVKAAELEADQERREV